MLVFLIIGCYCLALTISPGLRIHQFIWRELPISYLTGYLLWLAAGIFLQLIFQKRCPNAHPMVLPLVLFLSGMGILTVWRLQPTLGLRQNIWLWSSVPMAFLLTSPKFNIGQLLLKYRWLFLLGGVLITTMTIFIGIYPAGVGPQLWLNIGGFIFQPSEILKPIFIIILAGLFSSDKFLVVKSKNILLLSVVVIGIALFFFTLQKDFGTAAVLIFLYVFMLLHHTKKKWLLPAIFLLGVGALLIGNALIPHIHQRIQTWLNPWDDPMGISFQVTQSMIASAAGGLLGTGPGLGSPALIPLAHSDFIYAAMSEEIGWVGTTFLLSAFLSLIWFIADTDAYRKKSFSHFFAVGVAYYIAIQSFLIIAGNIKLIPLTGVTLPLVSSGGSSMLTTLFCLFTVIRFSHENNGVILHKMSTHELAYYAPRLWVVIIFSALAIYQLNWSVFQQKFLLARPENLRPMISDIYSPRGDIYDRNGNLLTTTVGQSGSYYRFSPEQTTSHLVGYSDINLGQSGIERFQNQILRGEVPVNTRDKINKILFNQHPNGYDIVLTVDSKIQAEVSKYFHGGTGAALLLNPQTGEILALVSSPGYDPNQLKGQINTLRSEPSAPLLNRVTQGQYAPGSILAPLYAAASITENHDLPLLPESYLVFYDGFRYECARYGVIAARWKDAIQAGCPAASVSLLESISDLDEFISSVGLLEILPLQLELSPPKDLPVELSEIEFALGISDFQASPLQIAFAYSHLYTDKQPIYPFYVKQVQQNGIPIMIPENTLPTQSIGIFSETAIEELMETLRDGDKSSFWYVLGSTYTAASRNVWFVGGTIPGDIAEVPLLLVLMIENDDAAFAQSTGLNILDYAHKKMNIQE